MSPSEPDCDGCCWSAGVIDEGAWTEIGDICSRSRNQTDLRRWCDGVSLPHHLPGAAEGLGSAKPSAPAICEVGVGEHMWVVSRVSIAYPHG